MTTADDFVRLAGRLATFTDSDGSAQRSAVSRAYYGAFHLARDLLHELGFSPPRNANVHAFVQQHLIGSDHADAVRAGSLLKDLHGDRNRADYRLDDDRWESPQFARLAVERAHEIRASLNRCRLIPSRTELLIGLQRFQAKLRG